jgi:Clostridium P-47 protein
MLTNGWDTVFATTIKTVNAQLSRATAGLIETFAFSQQGFAIAGSFGPWTIVTGGSGKLMLLEIPIATGTLTPSDGAPPIDIKGVSVILQVSLQLLPAPDIPDSHVLTFNLKRVGTSAEPGDGLVTPHEVRGGNLTMVQSAGLGMAVATCLVQNAGKVSFVFAKVNPTAAADAPWLHPVAMDYCYAAPVGGGDPMLAVLAVTSPRDISGLPRLVDPRLLAGAGNAGLAISAPLFMQHVFAPALAASLHTSANDFVSDTHGTLHNTGVIRLSDVHASGITYHPRATRVQATLVDTRITTTIAGDCDMYMNIKMDFTGSSIVDVRLDAGRRRIDLLMDGTPAFHKDVHVPWYDHLFDLVTIASEVVLQVCVAVISNQLASGIEHVTGASQLAAEAPALVSWAGSSGFTPQQGGLASAFYLRGTLT